MSNPTNKQITYLNIVNSTGATEGPIPFKVLAQNILELDPNNVEYTLEDFGIFNALPSEIDAICDFKFEE